MLQKGDMLKVDIGVHINGRIVDSAFTLNFNDHYDELLQAVRAATETGVRVRSPHYQALHPLTKVGRKRASTHGWARLAKRSRRRWNRTRSRLTASSSPVRPFPRTCPGL